MIRLRATVDEQRVGLRLDLFLVQVFPQYSRSYFQNLIKGQAVTVDLQTAKSNHKVKIGQNVDIFISESREIGLVPQDIELDVIYQDGDIAVINKPQGLVVHPAPGNLSGTLVNALLARLDNLSGINGELRPGIVHRLDKNTSGLLVVAKNDAAHHSLADQIKDRTAKRTYFAIVHNTIKQDSGTINAPIGRHPVHRKKMAIVNTYGSREAVTHFKVIERFKGFTFLEATLETGRTHQIRVHMAGIGHPVLGDTVYGVPTNPFGLDMQTLHAAKLTINHPTSKQAMEFIAPLPDYFNKTLLQLRENYRFGAL